MNCFEKLNPEEPLKIQSKCLNCNSITRVFYKWRLYKQEEGLPEDGLPGVEIQDLQEKTSTPDTNPNIALKSNVLQPGGNYMLRLKAWKDGGNEC